MNLQMALACIFFSTFSIWIGMVGNKDFFTMDYMMPYWLRNTLGVKEKKSSE